MSIKDTIQKIKAFLEEEANVEAVAENFTDIKTNDDIILSFEGELAVGTDIFVVSEAGREIAPDGDYFVENQKITVAEGKVASIEEVEPIEDEAPEEIPVAPAEEAMQEVNLTELAEKISALELKQAEIMEIISKLAENNSKENFKQELKAEQKVVIKKQLLSNANVVEKVETNPLKAFIKA